MPIQLSIRTDAASLLRGLTTFQREQLPFITAYALTTTGQMAIDAHKREMRRVFDRPVDWTVNSLFLTPAKKQDPNPFIRIGFKDFASKGTPAGRYLQWQINGGGREHKRFEKALIAAGTMLPGQYAVPTRRLVLDAHGNIPRGTITKILSDLQSSRDPTQNRNTARRGRGKLRMLAFFAITRPGSGLAPGIYLNIGPGQQILVIAYVRQPTYRKRYDWTGITKRAVEQGFAPAFRHAVQFATRTGRRRAA